jgi:hypothetical protein
MAVRCARRPRPPPDCRRDSFKCSSLCLVSLPNRTLNERVMAGRRCPWPETEDMRPVAAYWRNRAASQRRRVRRGSFAYYLGRDGACLGAPSTWYLDAGRIAALNTAPRAYSRRPWLRPYSPQEKRGDIHPRPQPPREPWLVFSHVHDREDRTRGTAPERLRHRHRNRAPQCVRVSAEGYDRGRRYVTRFRLQRWSCSRRLRCACGYRRPLALVRRVG